MTLSLVIPGRSKANESGIHNHEWNYGFPAHAKSVSRNDELVWLVRK